MLSIRPDHLLRRIKIVFCVFSYFRVFEWSGKFRQNPSGGFGDAGWTFTVCHCFDLWLTQQLAVIAFQSQRASVVPVVVPSNVSSLPRYTSAAEIHNGSNKPNFSDHVRGPTD